MPAQRFQALSLAIFLAASALFPSAPPALAESATGEGAKALAQDLAPYFGQSAIDRGLISVTPRGEDYEVRFDLQRVVDGFGLPGGTVQTDSFSFLAARLPDGTWRVKSDNFPKFAVRLPTPKGELGGMLASSGYVFEGVYDPKLAAFTSFTNQVAALDMKVGLPDADVVARITGMDARLQAAGLGDGSVSGKFKQTFRHMTETVKMVPLHKPDDPSPPPVSVSYDLGRTFYDGSLEGMRGKDLLALWAFFVAHQGKEEVTAHQAELKAMMLAALPLWNRISTTIGVENLAIEMPQGRFTAKSLVQTVGQTGLTAQAGAELGVKLDGLSLPAGLLPAWAAPLTPTALDVDIKLQMTGLDQLARAAIQGVDLEATQPWDSASSVKLLAMVMGGQPNVTLASGRLVSPSLSLYFHGDIDLLPKAIGTLTLEADGLDKSIAIVQGAAQGNAQLQGAVQMMTLAKSFAKPGADGRSVWVVDYGADGAISVNGRKMGPPAK